jgi:hypothetical protein
MKRKRRDAVGEPGVRIGVVPTAVYHDTAAFALPAGSR